MKSVTNEKSALHINCRTTYHSNGGVDLQDELSQFVMALRTPALGNRSTGDLSNCVTISITNCRRAKKTINDGVGL